MTGGREERGAMGKRRRLKKKKKLSEKRPRPQVVNKQNAKIKSLTTE